MIYQYNFFYTKFGIRLAGQLFTPPLPSIELLDLPKESILHYVTASPVESGPTSDEFIFRNIKKPIMVGHIVDNGDIKGNPRHLAVSSDAMIRTYHIKHRRFRVMRSLEASSRDPNTLIVYNYGLLSKLYRYMRSYYTEFYKFHNVQAAVWKNMAKVASESDRHQFIVIGIPTILPSIADLRIATTTLSQKVIKIFNTPESLTILELWKWFGDDRALSLLSVIPDDKLDRINIIFQDSGKWFVMNLGRMNKWRVATKEELEANPNANTKGIDGKQLQRRFLRLMMALMQVRSSIPEQEVVTPTITTPNELPITVIKQDVGIPKVDTTIDTKVIKTTEIELPSEVFAETTISNDNDESIIIDTEVEKQLDADLAELESISKNYHGELTDTGEVIETPVIKENATLEDGVMNVCDRLADSGIMSAAEYKRFNELAGSYRKILAPNGKETLDKFITIDPKVLAIESSHEFKDIPTVIDKSMLKSSLQDFDRKYIKNVLQKDVASAVMNLQNAGIVVTGYNTEHIESILGDVDEYTVNVRPIEGTPSILRFRLPVVLDDGSFISNCVKYSMRKLRGDVPIRKIRADCVALTSYYGKTFVSRSEKKVNNYSQWLRNQIMAKSINDEDETITKMYPTNCFDNSFICPRGYSTIALGFRGFDVVYNNIKYTLSFDHTKRLELYGQDTIDNYEKDGARLIGISNNTRGNTTYLVIGTNNEIYSTNNGILLDLCSLEELLGLDPNKAPIDHAELKVLGREIPIGLILGYELGLNRLIKLLGVEPRRVHLGSRVNLEEHEYSLVFEDETLVFSKDDKKASIILSGFNEYHKAIRNYSVYDFDKPGVYLNVLESNGSSARYLREIDLMYQMFIDPITRDLLVEMKEPTTFHGLLVRSCEMLLNDQHLDELDPAAMRIKGYERFSGAVYNELVKAIRMHNGKPGKQNKQIDFNPYAVWMAISQDPSVTLVSDINPINNLKESEAVTYSGQGGRNSRSMTKSTRMYHENDMGTISESTVDSGDVAINVFTSADPQFTSLRGMSKRYEVGKTGATALLSTTALLSVGSTVDD